MSMRIRSGITSRAFSRASCPSLAMPTTSISSCMERRLTSPSLNRAWSSARSTPIRSIQFSFQSSLGQANCDPSAVARTTGHGQAASRLLCPLPHYLEPKAVPRVLLDSPRIETLAVVANNEGYFVLAPHDMQPGPGGPGVLAYIGQRLLDYAQQLDL